MDCRVSTAAEAGNDLRELKARLGVVVPNSLEHAKILVRIGELLAGRHQEFQARSHLHVAERILSTDDHAPPSRSLILHSLSLTLREAPAPEATTAMDSKLEILGLHLRLNLALARIYRHHDPSVARQYEQRVATLLACR